ncbi:hypothetical protein BDZ97DRAFT_946985 [Flammula alnicola]|nr:hypothetical protein BDZ97DRAFT_946985 [Flammula alnicola]
MACPIWKRIPLVLCSVMSLTFWKPGTAGPGSNLDRASEKEENIIPYAPQDSYLSIQGQQERLPIFKHREKLLYCIEKCGVVIVVGQTGCGKTTQLPQYLLQAGWADNGHVIACTQPRRIAATSVAARVSDEVGTKLGDEVCPYSTFQSWSIFSLSSPKLGWIYYSFRGCQQQREHPYPLYDGWNALS